MKVRKVGRMCVRVDPGEEEKRNYRVAAGGSIAETAGLAEAA